MISDGACRHAASARSSGRLVGGPVPGHHDHGQRGLGRAPPPRNRRQQLLELRRRLAGGPAQAAGLERGRNSGAPAGRILYSAPTAEAPRDGAPAAGALRRRRASAFSGIIRAGRSSGRGWGSAEQVQPRSPTSTSRCRSRRGAPRAKIVLQPARRRPSAGDVVPSKEAQRPSALSMPVRWWTSVSSGRGGARPPRTPERGPRPGPDAVGRPPRPPYSPSPGCRTP